MLRETLIDERRSKTKLFSDQFQRVRSPAPISTPSRQILKQAMVAIANTMQCNGQ